MTQESLGAEEIEGHLPLIAHGHRPVARTLLMQVDGAIADKIPPPGIYVHRTTVGLHLVTPLCCSGKAKSRLVRCTDNTSLKTFLPRA